MTLKNPAISRKQAKQSIMHLEKLGLIIKDQDGVYRVSQKGLATDPEVESLSLVRFYNSCARLATDALNTMPKKKRNISGVAMGVSEKTYQEITERITGFRKEINTLYTEMIIAAPPDGQVNKAAADVFTKNSDTVPVRYQ